MASQPNRAIPAAAAMIMWCCSPAGAGGGAPTPPAVTVKELVTQNLEGVAGKEIRMIRVEYLPGGASLPHRHNAQVFVYVLEGSIRMQVKGAAPVTLGPGETFYEGPEDIHTVSANASRTKPARILVFMVKDVGAPLSIAVPAEGHP